MADDVYAGRFLFGHHGVFWRLAGHCREDFYRNVDGVFHVSLDVDMADDRVRMGDEHHSTGRSVDGKTAKIFDTVPEIRDSEETDILIKHIDGEIEFKNVSFTHKGAAKPTLKNIDLKIPKGTTLAIVGYTGSGKSTFVNLLPRLYDVTEGELLLDGVNIKKIPWKFCVPMSAMNLRKHICSPSRYRKTLAMGVDGIS